MRDPEGSIEELIIILACSVLATSRLCWLANSVYLLVMPRTRMDGTGCFLLYNTGQVEQLHPPTQAHIGLC